MSSFAYLFERYPSFVQTFCYREVEEMRRQGMDPLIISIRRPDDPPECADGLGGEVLYLPDTAEIRRTARLPRRVRWTVPRERREHDVNRLFEAIWLAPRLRARGIRHVHAHFGGVAARTAWWLRRVFGIRYSFTGHANDIFCETDFPVSNADLVRDARFVVTETDYARRWMEARHAAARGKLFRVFNGIAPDGFPPRAAAGAVPRIVSVGRYVEKKGFADLIAACGLLRARGVEFTCEIVGGGPLEEELQAQIDAAQLGAVVRLPGSRPQPEVRRLLAGAQLFVLACVVEAGGGSDNLPTVIMEAMACGTPVISTRVAGVPEMIADGTDGLLTPPHDPPALAAAMEKLLRDPALAAGLAAQARKSAAEKFSIENTTRVLRHLLIEHAGVIPPEAARRFDPTLPAAPKRGWLARLFP